MERPFAHSKIDCVLTTGIYEGPLAVKRQGPSLRHGSLGSKCRAEEGETLTFPLWQVNTWAWDAHNSGVLGICHLAWPGKLPKLLRSCSPRACATKSPTQLRAGVAYHPHSLAFPPLELRLAFSWRLCETGTNETSHCICFQKERQRCFVHLGNVLILPD